MKNSGIEWIGEIPDSWDTLPLKRMVEKHFGGCWGEDAKNNDNDVLCIRIADFNFDNQSIKESAETIRNYTDAQIEKGLLKDGDLIVEKSGGGDKTPVGRVVIFDEEKFPQKAMFANFSECLRLKNTYSHRYIAYHLKGLYYSYDMHYYFHQTTGIQNLDMQEYLATMICVPSVEQQCAIVETLDEKCGKIDELIANQEKQIEKLKEYKQSVITEAVTKGLDKSAPLKDSGIEWIGNIPNHWNVCRIKSLADNSITDSFIDGDWIESPDITDEGIRYLTTGNVGDGVFKCQGNGYVSKDTFNRLNCKYAYPGDLVISRLNSPYGRSCILPDIEEEYVLAVDLVILRTQMEKRFICYSTQCVGYQHSVEDYARGTAMKRISRTNLGAVQILIPKLSEQKEIADYLDEKCGKIDRLIAIKQEKIEKLQEYKKSLIYEYVTGKKEVV